MRPFPSTVYVCVLTHKVPLNISNAPHSSPGLLAMRICMIREVSVGVVAFHVTAAQLVSIVKLSCVTCQFPFGGVVEPMTTVPATANETPDTLPGHVGTNDSRISRENRNSNDNCNNSFYRASNDSSDKSDVNGNSDTSNSIYASHSSDNSSTAKRTSHVAVVIGTGTGTETGSHGVIVGVDVHDVSDRIDPHCFIG